MFIRKGNKCSLLGVIFTEWWRLHMFPLWQSLSLFFLARFMAVKDFCVFCWLYSRLQQTFVHSTFWVPSWQCYITSGSSTNGNLWHWRSIWTFCCFPCLLLVPVVMFPFVRLYLSCASRLFFSFDMQPDGGVLSTKVATFELHRVVGKHQDRLTLVGHLNDIYAPR